MANHPFQPFRFLFGLAALAMWQRVGLWLAIVALWIGLYLALFPVMGSGAKVLVLLASLSAVPLLGFWGALGAGLATSLGNLGLRVAQAELMVSDLGSAEHIAEAVAHVAIIAVVARHWGLTVQVRQEADRRKQAQLDLQGARDDLDRRVRDRTRRLSEANDRLQRANAQLQHEANLRRMAEDERFELEAQMRHAQKLESLGVLAGGIAHDFNNILGSVLGSADVALLNTPPEHPAHKPLQRIRAGAERGADLTRLMLSYAGKSSDERTTADLRSIVEDMGRLLEVGMPRTISVGRDFDDRLPLVRVDQAQFQQVVMNLVTNAADALADQPGGQISVRIEDCELDAEWLAPAIHGPGLGPGRFVRLVVEDNGCGMTAETRARMFDPFFSTKLTGRGLGLSAVSGIVLQHGGGIRVDSTEGQGTTISIALPVGPPTPPEAETPPEAPVSAPPDAAFLPVILVVDDEPDVLAVVGDMLDLGGYRVLRADGGDQALALFAAHAHEIGAVLLDVTMPPPAGPATLKALRSHDPDVQVVLMTGFAGSAPADLVTDLHPAGVLRKPFDRRTLDAVLRRTLGNKR